MGNPKAFLEIHRQEAGYRPIHDRIHDFGEVEQTLSTRERKLQASRCMDCGVPFCHWACPLGNKAPEWNDALYKGDFELAFQLLTSTNPFPEFTGRICPPPIVKTSAPSSRWPSKKVSYSLTHISRVMVRRWL